MRKILNLIFCLVLVTQNLVAAAEVKPPTWDEFCPQEYLNAEYKPGIGGKIKNFTWGEEMFAVTLVGFPIAMVKYNKRQEYNYWTSRRYSFNKAVQSCLASTDNQAACFMQVRQLEESKTMNSNLYKINNSINRLRY